MLPTVTTTLQTVLMICCAMATHKLTNKSGEFLDGVVAHINALKTLKKI